MKQKQSKPSTKRKLNYYEGKRVQSWLEFAVWLVVWIVIVLLILTITTGCATNSTQTFPTCTSRVQTPCLAPVLTNELPDREARARENATRWIGCGEKVTMLMKDIELCNQQRE